MKVNSARVALVMLIAVLLSAGMASHPGKALAQSQARDFQAIDAYVTERMHTLKIPGLAIAIVKDGQIEYSKGYGIADPSGRPVTPQTPFMLASLSKSFTALAIMQLVEQGKLDLDAPVKQYLSWFRAADEETSAKITVHQLLYQTSGFSTVDGNLRNLDTSLAADALETNMRQLGDVRLLNEPGQAFHYSNINYGLLGAIVAAVSGQPFEDYVQQHILDPLDMQNSYTSWEAARQGGASSGFYPFFSIPVVYDRFRPYSEAVTPWAGIFSSAQDMAHYLVAHLDDGQYDGKAVISPAGMAALHKQGVSTDKWSGYAMGWWVTPEFDLASQDQMVALPTFRVPLAITHEGSWADFRTIALMVPDTRMGVVVLMNTDDPAIESAYGMIGWQIASIYSGHPAAYYPPQEDFIRQHARLVFSALLLILLASLVWFVRRIRQFRVQRMSTAARGRTLGLVLLTLLLDGFIAWYLLAKELPQSDATVLFLLRMAPDLGLLLILILVLTIGWGILRTILMIAAMLHSHI